MCGIVGYTGDRNAAPILLAGLGRLEYRGYDSSGIALIQNDNLIVRKKQGKVEDLRLSLEREPTQSLIGLGHTRWATHGVPSEQNAHPHVDNANRIALIHNGIIENHAAIKEFLLSEGYQFYTSTDTEVLAQLVGHHFHANLADAVREAVNQVEGSYSIAVIAPEDPLTIVAARNGAPLVIGIGEGEYFIASDTAAFLEHTNQIITLEDHEIAVITPDGVNVSAAGQQHIRKEISTVASNLEQIEKNGFEHFMLKEIYDQPRALEAAMRGRIDPGGINYHEIEAVLSYLKNASRIYLTACGTSWHAALIGEYLLEQIAGVAVEVEYASEFRYRRPIIDKKTVVVAISQSGETADTLAAMKMAKEQGAMVIGIANTVGSSVSLASDEIIYINAGPEIGVASTKSFTSQVMVLILLAKALGERTGRLDASAAANMAQAIEALPEMANASLGTAGQVQEIAAQFERSRDFLYLGRGLNFPVALEGALKMKEISYIHAEGYPAAEMKHGPIALIDENMPVVCIAPRDDTYGKILSNIQEVKARRGRIIALTSEGDKGINELADHIIQLPETIPALYPILAAIPLQLLAYHIAVGLGLNVDQPRNLAKCVTVE
ncbi:MAG: glutamine--fructose-6-phosphate transaminase (isomerizing) [Candidatus Marinimicrobia bacterium]|nr:glutamine--fructose-6-phosphate transaminase (isomerizing) [Candidatus Neomarinimicrobiota bacterium]